MTDLILGTKGKAGIITLNRPAALNALSYDMVTGIEAALDQWRDDPAVELVIIDGAGDRAFCAGGDIAKMYETGRAGDYGFGQKFWRDEYRMNAKLFEFPKPVVSFLHGFVMGGGVGVGCHASHRIVCATSQIAMPECGIGLVPDVGGTLWLARAPGRLGEFLGITGDRMDAGDAIYAGFADYFVPQDQWEGLKTALCDTGDLSLIDTAAATAPASRLQAWQADIDAVFGGERLGDCIRAFDRHPSDAVEHARKAIARNSPLAMCVAVENIHRVRARDTIRFALEIEYRFTHRALEHSDFLEGIRAAIIDKDRSPKWKHAGWRAVTGADVLKMTLPVTEVALSFEKESPMKVAFIGLGNMGAPMAANLVKSGFDVVGFDTVAQPEGLPLAATAAEAAAGADVVITMLPNGAILRAVAAEIHPAMKSGAIHLDCSTVDVDSARDVAQAAAHAGLEAMDAPVSGGVGGAAAGTLTFMAGGSDAAFAKVTPLFDVMGQKAVHCGASGAGQAAKICNNMILGVTMIATCEAFALADKLGLDRQKMFDVVSTSSGYSWTMNAYCPAPGVGPKSPADNGYKPGFAAELMLKDLGLSQMAAKAADADTPMGQLALSLYQQFVEHEDGRGMDFSAMLPRFEKRGRG
jgi:3-hydroxyisobutyrate dehydrogenase